MVPLSNGRLPFWADLHVRIVFYRMVGAFFVDIDRAVCHVLMSACIFPLNLQKR
jgi:hypothetical protein